MQKPQITNSKSQIPRPERPGSRSQSDLGTNHKSQNPKRSWLLEFRSSKIIWNFQKREAQNGFTLIEMAVATGIFTVLVVAAVSVMISVTKAQAMIQRIQTSIDNVRFSLELITKEMRVGTNYESFACPSGSGIRFTTSTLGKRIYYFDTATERIMRSKTALCADAVPFTAEDVRVDRFSVLLRGNTLGASDGQPWVTFSMKVTVLDPKGASDFAMDLQTSVVQRGRDFP